EFVASRIVLELYEAGSASKTQRFTISTSDLNNLPSLMASKDSERATELDGRLLKHVRKGRVRGVGRNGTYHFNPLSSPELSEAVRVPHCPKCGYILKANESGKCPECGEAISARTAS